MVKKIYILSLFFLFSTLALSAQGKHEINAFIGGFQTDFTKIREDSSQTGDLYDLYEPHFSAQSGPVLTVNYHYVFNSFLRLGAQLSYGSMEGKKTYRMGSRQQEKFNLHSLAVLPQVKLNIPGMRHFRIYGKAGIGLKLNMGTYDISPVQFAWEVVPFGAEWGGHRVYGNAEICYGSVIRGGRIGMGFRF